MGKQVIQPKHRGLLFAALVAGLTGAATSGAAEQYPSQTVKIIVPNPAGGTADALPRIVADALTGVWKQSVVVENRTGAAGNVGAESFSRAQADGYNQHSKPPTTHPIKNSLYRNQKKQPNKLKAKTVIATTPKVVSVSPKLGV